MYKVQIINYVTSVVYVTPASCTNYFTFSKYRLRHSGVYTTWYLLSYVVLCFIV